MSVSHILKLKGRDVITVLPSATVKDVAEVLAGKRIGAVIVSSGGGVTSLSSILLSWVSPSGMYVQQPIRAGAIEGYEAVKA